MTMEREVARLTAAVEQQTEAFKDLRTQIAKMDERQVGHHVRIDRLEQTEARRSKWAGVVTTSWLGLAVAWVWDRMHRG